MFDMQNYNSFGFQPVMTTRSSSSKVLGRNFNAKGSFTSNGDSSEFKTSSKESNMRLRKTRDMKNPWGKVVKVDIFWNTTYFLLETQNTKSPANFQLLIGRNPRYWFSSLGALVLCSQRCKSLFTWSRSCEELDATHQTHQTPRIFFFHLHHIRSHLIISPRIPSILSIRSFAFSFIRFKVPVIFAIWAPSNGKHVKITTLEMGKSRRLQPSRCFWCLKRPNKSNEWKLDPRFQNGSLFNLILRFVLIGRRCILCQKHIERDPAHVKKVWLLRLRSNSQWLGGFRLKICKKQIWFANY